MLNFQRLDVYQRAIRFLDLVYAITESQTQKQADQLVRSAESIIRNIAEGAGRWTPADASHRYTIARGEAMECAASLDVMKLRAIVSEEQYADGMRHLEAIVQMLTKMT